MQLFSAAYSMILAFCFATANPPAPTGDSSVFKVFSGTTPCSNIIRPLNKISPEADCELEECHCAMVEWKLTLYHHPATAKATTYKLISVNRFIVKETNQFSQPGTRIETEGKWAVDKGTSGNPDATVYQLNPDKPALLINLVKLNDNLLHILDKERKLMIGNEFWSYTLNGSN